MRKKTIGEVLRLARTNQGLTLEELHKKTEIQLDMLEAMEADDFDQLPSPFYIRSFLRKYAWAVELDERIILDAYDSGTMITYEEQEEYQADKVEKERIAKLVKEMNKGVKKDKSKPTSAPKNKQAPRFPGR